MGKQAQRGSSQRHSHLGRATEDIRERELYQITYRHPQPVPPGGGKDKLLCIHTELPVRGAAVSQISFHDLICKPGERFPGKANPAVFPDAVVVVEVTFELADELSWGFVGRHAFGQISEIPRASNRNRKINLIGPATDLGLQLVFRAARYVSGRKRQRGSVDHPSRSADTQTLQDQLDGSIV